jgi:hypothetical protein
MSAETREVRKAGLRLLSIGLAFLAAGLVILVVADQRTGGAVTHPEISRAGRGISFLAGFPATLGYVMSAVGVYRLLRGRGPGHASTSPIVGALRVLFIAAVALVFFVGAFYIVMTIRDPSAAVPRPPAP